MQHIIASPHEHSAKANSSQACTGDRMNDEPEQEAIFEVEGPGEDACVWIQSTDPRNRWTQNLGPRDKVAEVLSQWLGFIDYGEDG
jgi:hypothetical protein